MYMAESVGIRDLRQNLSVYLERVKKGERLTVTSHNKPVAELIPFGDEDDPLQRLIDRGLATAPKSPFGDWEPLDLGKDISLSEALEYTRGYR